MPHEPGAPRDISSARGARAVPGQWRAKFSDGSIEEYVFSKTPGVGELPLSAWEGIDRSLRARRNPSLISFGLSKIVTLFGSR